MTENEKKQIPEKPLPEAAPAREARRARPRPVTGPGTAVPDETQPPAGKADPD